MIGFIIGLFVGGAGGFFLCALLTVGKRADENQPSQ